MSTLNEDLSAIKEVEDKIVANKVARFAYTDEAYTTNDANGVAEYDVSREQNIPTADASVLKVNETVLSKGYRAQASSVTRMLLNHFFGRMSYNLNKVNDIVSNLIATLIGHRGTANGFATLDENGRIPYSQLPESAMEYKGNWNAETNVPPLSDGTGTKGDFYIVSVGGTQNLGSGNIQFFVNDRIIYDGSVWARLSAGDVNTVNNVLPTNGNVALTGENIPVSSTDPTLLSAPLTTDRYADSSVTNAKIKEPISVANGGTGATTAKNGFTNLANGLSEASNPQDTEYMIYKSGGNWGLHTLSTFWNYIKGKISSVLGLTKDNYGGMSAKSSFLDEYIGAGGTRLTSLNIVPKDASEYGGMRKDIAPASVTDDNPPGANGHLLTMFWDNAARYDNQLFIAGTTVKVRRKANETDYEPWVDIITSNNIGSQTVANAKTANKIVTNYTSVNLTQVTSNTIKYIKIADCNIIQAGTLQVFFSGGHLVDTLVINFGSGTALEPMLCGYYSGNDHAVYSVIAQKGSSWNQSYSIYVKVWQSSDCNVNVALLKGECTINVTESTTAPTDIYEWTVKYGLFGDFTGNVTGNLTGNVYGSAGIGMAHTCSTPSGTKEKTVSIPGFTLTQGACIRVVFNNGNSVVSPTLNVNNTGAKEIFGIRGALDTIITALDFDSDLKRGRGVCNWDVFTILDLYYGGTSWTVIGDPIVKRFYDGTANLTKNVSITGIVNSGILY